MMKIIAAEGKGRSINKFILMDKLGVSTNTYEKMVERFKFQFGHLASYDPHTKSWSYIGKE